MFSRAGDRGLIQLDVQSAFTGWSLALRLAKNRSFLSISWLSLLRAICALSFDDNGAGLAASL